MMKTIRLAWAEIGRHHRPLHRIALSFMLIVPTLYGALYLWSNWDPYGKLDQIPVAVVNEDVPVEVDGKTVDAGSLVVENLKKDPIFDWVYTDSDDASTGLAQGDYYLTITIPSDFSDRLASGAGNTPERATIEMQRNDANGYVIGVMAETVQAKLHEQINAAATQAYFESVYGSLATLRDGLGQADDGATRLQSGLADADTGSHTLADGLGEAQTGSQTLADGLGEAATGAHTLADKLGELADGATQVAGGTEQIADIVNPLANDVVPAIPTVVNGARDVTSTVSDLTGLVAGGGDTLAGRADEVSSAVDALVAANPDLADDPLVTELRDAVGRVDARVDEIDQKLDGVHADAKALDAEAQKLQNAIPDMQNKVRDGQAKVNELNDGAHQVATGAGEARDGAATLASKLDEAHDGGAELASKLGEAHDGATTLADGLTTASSGSGELVAGLDKLVAAVPALDVEERERNAGILGNPTQVSLAIDNPAGVYGRGLAPFFFSIALWVFGIVIFLVLRPTSGRALVSHAPSWRVALVGWLPIFGIGLAGSYLLLGVSTFALGLDPVHGWGSIGVITLAVAVFTMLAHLARSALGLVGSAVLLVVLMLQLAASAGIYPAQTLPPALLAIHPYLPMTYLIEALRVVFTGGSSEVLRHAVLVLVGVGLAAFAGSWAVIARKRTWTMADLHPPLED